MTNFDFIENFDFILTCQPYQKQFLSNQNQFQHKFDYVTKHGKKFDFIDFIGFKFKIQIQSNPTTGSLSSVSIAISDVFRAVSKKIRVYNAKFCLFKDSTSANCHLLVLRHFRTSSFHTEDSKRISQFARSKLQSRSPRCVLTHHRCAMNKPTTQVARIFSDN